MDKNPLDAKEVRVGMRVVKVSGEREGTAATVRGVDVQENLIGVLFDGDTKTTFACNAGEFQILKKPGIRLTGRPPPGTIARGSL